MAEEMVPPTTMPAATGGAMLLPSSVCARGSTSACVGWSSRWQRSHAVCNSAMLIWTSGSRG